MQICHAFRGGIAHIDIDCTQSKRIDISQYVDQRFRPLDRTPNKRVYGKEYIVNTSTEHSFRSIRTTTK